MSMKITDRARELSVSPPCPRASKPAVRRVTDWNRALSPFCHRGMGPRVAGLRYSTAKKNSAPNRMSAAVRLRTRRL